MVGGGWPAMPRWLSWARPVLGQQTEGKGIGSDAPVAVPPVGGAGWGVPSHTAMRVAKSGIVFSGKLGLQEWEAVGQRLMTLADSASWWIADWLAYGESTFLDRYREAVKKTSLSYQTLRNYTWVARRVELSRRRDSLSFGHHAEVAALGPPEQDYWLRKGERARLVVQRAQEGGAGKPARPAGRAVP